MEEYRCIPLGIIVLQSDLQLDGFSEVAFLLVGGVCEKVLDVLSNIGDRYFTTIDVSMILFVKGWVDDTSYLSKVDVEQMVSCVESKRPAV
jgi:hypothetical protein